MVTQVRIGIIWPNAHAFDAPVSGEVDLFYRYFYCIKFVGFINCNVEDYGMGDGVTHHFEIHPSYWASRLYALTEGHLAFSHSAFHH